MMEGGKTVVKIRGESGFGSLRMAPGKHARAEQLVSERMKKREMEFTVNVRHEGKEGRRKGRMKKK